MSYLAAPLTMPCLMLMTACGASSGGGATSSATVGTASTVAPTPDARAIAAQQYLAAATTANSADKALGKTVCGQTTYSTAAQAKSCWSKYVVVEQAFLTSIFGITYPPPMKPDVDAQITAETKVVADESTLAGNPVDATAHAAYETDTTAATGTANIVRHDLGLPQVGS
jgi:hypothetical protein